MNKDGKHNKKEKKSENGRLPVLIRPSTPDDLAAISELENVIFPDPWPLSAFEEALADNECCQLVAEYDGRVVGYAVYLTDSTESRLINIAVAPEYRRKSVAKQLLRHILDVVSETDCRLVLLEVRPSNFEARKLYGEFGFRDLYRKPNYYRRPAEDALVMVRHLRED